MSFYYLATPYSKYPQGIQAAFEAASREAALLVRHGIPVYCPIAHTHPIAIHGEMDPFDHSIWLEADRTFMEAAKGLIVCQMEGWEQSYGMGVEIRHFVNADKPIFYMTPGLIPQDLPNAPGSDQYAPVRNLSGDADSGIRHSVSPADQQDRRDLAGCDPFYRGTD